MSWTTSSLDSSIKVPSCPWRISKTRTQAVKSCNCAHDCAASLRAVRSLSTAAEKDLQKAGQGQGKEDAPFIMGFFVLGGLGRVACIGSLQHQHIEGRLGPALTMQNVPQK